MDKKKPLNDQYKIIAVLPARYGSTRLPGKPLIKINGKPVIQYVYENISNSKMIDEVVVATDDSRIFDETLKFGGKAVMTPSECKSGTDRIVYTIKNCGFNNYDIIVNVQGDEPLLKCSDVESVILRLIKNDSDISTLAIKFKNISDVKNPNHVKAVLDKNFNALYFSRNVIPYPRDSEIIPENYYKHIGVYVFKKHVLLKFETLPDSILEHTEKLEQLRLLESGYKISVAVTENETIGIDTPEDVEKFNFLINSQNKKQYDL
ncbi:3-deoxy-manno-octulosonate cytidylyltransferase [Candidatus Dependentiae bacterium]|nr:3-deoxy-manno-octulosonate cytidylyltransferase [Candidatus Dependentiae bacterium]